MQNLFIRSFRAKTMTQKTNPSYPAFNPADMEGLDGLMTLFKRSLLMSLRVALPAVVKSFDAAANRVDLTPAITSASNNGETVTLPELSAVPVCTAGGGGFGASFPLQAGDTGWVIFCDRDISLFKDSGVISPANTNRLHNLADAVFYPDVMGKIKVADAGCAVWQKLDGSVKVVLSDSSVSITGNTNIKGDLSATGNVSVSGNVSATGTITSGVDVIAGGISLKAHVHGGVTGGQGTTGVPQ